MDYKTARAYIDNIGKKGSILGLESMRCLMKHLNHVEESLNIIHVAGTNGKGSVSTYIASILQEAGYKVGRYASPAVFEYLEIISINGTTITSGEYGIYMESIKEAVSQMTASGNNEPTAFEIETALAFLYFYEKKCDFVILETGMGGRLDATNIITSPICSVITAISMDHMAFLGDTIEAIAGEKAGIIKKNCPVVSAKQIPQVELVLKQKAEQEQTTIYTPNTPHSIQYHEEGTTISYASYNGAEYPHIKTQMLGTFQIENMTVAIETIECLNHTLLTNHPISTEQITAGIRYAMWPGRFQKISDNPRIYIDGGHNEGAAKRLKETLQIYFTNSKIIFIMGVLRDKEYAKILELLSSFPSEIITITPDNPRALSGMELKEAALKYHENVTYCDSLETALTTAKKSAGTDGVILIFGSLSFLGKLNK